MVFAVVAVVVVVIVAHLWSDILHLDDVAALAAALDGSVAACDEPEDLVGVGWDAGAADVLLFTEGADDDGVFHGACASL